MHAIVPFSHRDVDALQHVAAAVARDNALQRQHRRAHLHRLLEYEVLAQVGVEDLRVALDLVGRALRDRLAAREHEHRVAEAEHERHVVLDDQERLALRVELADHLAHPLDQRRVDAAGGLVEHDQLRVEHQHLRELDELLLAVGERARPAGRGTSPCPTKSSSSSARSASGPLTAPAASWRDAGTSRSGATTFSSTVISRNSRVIWNVRPMPRCARRHGRMPVDPLAVEPRPRRRRALIVPSIRLKTVVLPEPFGPISAVIEPSGTANEHAVDRAQAAEALLEALDLEQRRGRRRPRRPRAPRARAARCGVEPRADQAGLAARAPLSASQSPDRRAGSPRQEQHGQREQPAEDEQARVAAAEGVVGELVQPLDRGTRRAPGPRACRGRRAASTG